MEISSHTFGDGLFSCHADSRDMIDNSAPQKMPTGRRTGNDGVGTMDPIP
jgi:hypothetical protein